MGITNFNKIHPLLGLLLFFFSSCTYVYDNDIALMLGSPEIDVTGVGRFESQAMGEWYILEKYQIPHEQIRRIVADMDTVSAVKMHRHPYLKDSYWIGWHRMNIGSPYDTILQESITFAGEDSVLQAYTACCKKGQGYFTIMVRDSTFLQKDYVEKTILIVDSVLDAVYICNYHY